MFNLKKDNIKDIKLSDNFNFDNDLKPLNFLIDLEISNFRFTLELDKDKKILSDYDVLTVSVTILDKVIKAISKHYLDTVLSKYINKECHTTFISQFIVKELIKIGLKKNQF